MLETNAKKTNTKNVISFNFTDVNGYKKSRIMPEPRQNKKANLVFLSTPLIR